MDLLRPGPLWDRIISTTEQAIASGALLPVATDQEFVDADGVRYLVRVLAGLRRKDEARKAQNAAARAGRQANPFLAPGAASGGAGRGGRGTGGAGEPGAAGEPAAGGGRGGRGGFQVDPGVFKVTVTVDGKEVETKRLTISPHPLFT